MVKVKMLQETNVSGTVRSVGEVIEVEESLAEVYVRDGVASAHTEESTEAPAGSKDSTSAAPAAGEGEAASA